MGLMWLRLVDGADDGLQRFIRSTHGKSKSNQKLNNSNNSNSNSLLRLAHDPSRARLITASTGSILYTSQVTEITGVLEPGKSDGEGGTRGMVDAVIRRYACERNVPA